MLNKVIAQNAVSPLSPSAPLSAPEAEALTASEAPAQSFSLGGTAEGLAGAHHGRMDFIDSIRGLAALFVVICHAYFEPANGYYAGRVMNHLGLTYGHIAVDVFIVISGFCLMLPCARRGMRMPSVKSFFAQRCRRILPPYWAAILLSAGYIVCFAHQPTGTVWDNSLPLTWASLAGHLLLLQDFPVAKLNTGMIDYPLWTIAVEFQIYFFMPPIVWAMRTLRPMATTLIAVAAGELLHFLSRGWLDSACPWYIGLFTFGCVAANASLRVDGMAAKRWKIAAAVLALPTVAFILLEGKDRFDSYSWLFDALIGAAFALWLAAAMTDAMDDERRSPLMRFLNWPPLVSMGVFSYSLYLMHAPLLHLLDRLYTRLLHAGSVTMFLLLVASTPVIVGASYLFHLAFERPFMRKAKANPSGLSATFPEREGT